MAQLNDFIKAYIPQDLRGTRDFADDRGWINLINLLLKKIDRNNLFKLSRTIERGVVPSEDYWITKPTDLRAVIKIWDPDNPTRDMYTYQMLWDKIKLDRAFTAEEDPDAYIISNILPGPPYRTITVSIDDADSDEDEYIDWLMMPTDGTYKDDGVLINDSADVGAVTQLAFRHSQPADFDSGNCYMTQTYLMMKYYQKFSPMTAYDEEIPINDDYEDLARYWLCKESLRVNDKRRKAYEELFKNDWDEAVVEHQTPSPDQARVPPVNYPQVNYSDDSTFDWTGETG